jgi:hypothetical protein
VIGIILLIGVAVVVVSELTPTPQPAAVPTTPTPPREPTAEERAAEAVFQANVASVQRLKSAMKNPASFSLEQALRMDDGVLCVTYRATNSFNAVVPGRAVITATKILTPGQDGFTGRWNARCAKKSGVDVTYIRQALF